MSTCELQWAVSTIWVTVILSHLVEWVSKFNRSVNLSCFENVNTALAKHTTEVCMFINTTETIIYNSMATNFNHKTIVWFNTTTQDKYRNDNKLTTHIKAWSYMNICRTEKLTSRIKWNVGYLTNLNMEENGNCQRKL